MELTLEAEAIHQFLNYGDHEENLCIVAQRVKIDLLKNDQTLDVELNHVHEKK